MKRTKFFFYILTIFSLVCVTLESYSEETNSIWWGSVPQRTATVRRASSGQTHYGRGTRRRRAGVSRSCPFGIGPMNYRVCPAREQAIIKRIAGAQANCYGRLFVAESTTCSPGVYHDARKARNPYAGIGICALERSPGIRRMNRRGPNCVNISTFERQVRCCIDINRKTQARYFGTVKCKKAPRC